MVVSNDMFFQCSPNVEKIPMLTDIFQRGRNPPSRVSMNFPKMPALRYCTVSYKGLNMMFRAGYVANSVSSQILQANCIWR